MKTDLCSRRGDSFCMDYKGYQAVAVEHHDSAGECQILYGGAPS